MEGECFGVRVLNLCDTKLPKSQGGPPVERLE